MRATHKIQSGMMLLEALIGILIFSIGILALIAMQARAVSTLADAQYRVEAVTMVNRLVSQIWVNADRSNLGALQGSVMAFAHRPGGTPGACDANGTASANPIVTEWEKIVTGNGGATKPILPGSNDPQYQQVLVELVAPPIGGAPIAGAEAVVRVTVTLCWIAPNEAPGSPPHHHTVVAYVN
jgi:type IV pilus assembly protein PilV